MGWLVRDDREAVVLFAVVTLEEWLVDEELFGS